MIVKQKSIDALHRNHLLLSNQSGLSQMIYINLMYMMNQRRTFLPGMCSQTLPSSKDGHSNHFSRFMAMSKAKKLVD